MRLPEAQKHLYTISEYLSMERNAAEKHEYRNGEVIAMAGGSPRRSLISMNLGGELRSALKGKPCRAYESNLRVRIPKTPLYNYPDVTVICGEPQFDENDERMETITNPRLIAEVLSPSAESYDRGKKFAQYREIETLQEFLLVSQDSPDVELFIRGPNGDWIIKPHLAGLESHLKLESLNISLPLAEIYAGVKFDTKPENAGDQARDGAI